MFGDRMPDPRIKAMFENRRNSVRSVFLSSMLLVIFLFVVIPAFAATHETATGTKTTKQRPPRVIYILVFNKIDRPVVKKILPEISRQFFGLPVRLLPAAGKENPDWTERTRGQAQAETVIASVRKDLPPDGLRIAALVTVDLYTGRFPYVFGAGDPKSGAAVLSTFRLRTPEKLKYQDRLLKGLVHELIHTFGLTHCIYPTCVMYFTPSLSDFDYKPVGPCNTCRGKLRRALLELLPDEPRLKAP